MGVRARLRAVCVVANPRNSQAIAVVCASQPIPNRIPHTFIRDHEHVLRAGASGGRPSVHVVERFGPGQGLQMGPIDLVVGQVQGIGQAGKVVVIALFAGQSQLQEGG